MSEADTVDAPACMAKGCNVAGPKRQRDLQLLPVQKPKVRKAVRADAVAIHALVRAERLNPTGLFFERFMVVELERRIIAAAQIRRHADGARELGSLVVAPDHRDNGVAGLLIDALLASESGPIFMVSGAMHAPHFARWGFMPVAPRAVPRSVRWNFWMGRVASFTVMLRGRKRKRLVIYHRAPLFPSANATMRTMDTVNGPHGTR
jgi:amino-acid N-acetyltransferase